jgi:hypothetical protein
MLIQTYSVHPEEVLSDSVLILMTLSAFQLPSSGHDPVTQTSSPGKVEHSTQNDHSRSIFLLLFFIFFKKQNSKWHFACRGQERGTTEK